MMNPRTVVVCAFAIALTGSTLEAQDLSRYRDFALGMDLAAVSALTGVPSSEATVVHQRPALLQNLEWRPSRWTPGSRAESTDPVERVAFSFYDDRLFQIVVDYGRDRTEGLTDGDMFDAISAVYGPRTTPARRPAGAQSQLETESGSLVARWADANHSVVLYHTSSYGDTFRLFVTDAAVAGLARKAASQALRLDDQEAPRREIERQKKERAAARAAADKARSANKGLFKP
jgi:hypothetical protein